MVHILQPQYNIPATMRKINHILQNPILSERHRQFSSSATPCQNRAKPVQKKKPGRFFILCQHAGQLTSQDYTHENPGFTMIKPIESQQNYLRK
jgi:hypothetical protein